LQQRLKFDRRYIEVDNYFKEAIDVCIGNTTGSFVRGKQGEILGIQGIEADSSSLTIEAPKRCDKCAIGYFYYVTYKLISVVY
jgi:hypothetical protein